MVMVVVSSLEEIRDCVALIELKCLQLLELDLSNTANPVLEALGR